MNAPFEGTLNYWILQTAAMLLTAALIPGLRITGILGATLTVAGLAMVNATVWDAALFLSVPSAPTTHALTLLVANGAIFWVLVKLLPGIEIEGVLPALAAPIVFTCASLLIDRYGRQIDWVAVTQWSIAMLESLRDYLLDSQPGGAGQPLPSAGAAAPPTGANP